MGFKEDADFARFVSMGAVGAAAVATHLRSRWGHHPIELERYAMANKVWQTKVKRLRLPDLVCLRCGLRVESRAKSKLGLILSHSDVEGREWDAGGMRDGDLYAFLRTDVSQDDPYTSKPFYFTTAALRASITKTRRSNPKASSEGSEVTLTWPSWIPPRRGTFLEVDQDRLIVCEWLDGRTYKYWQWRKWGEPWFIYIEPGATIEAGETIVAGVVAPTLEITCVGQIWDLGAALAGSDVVDRYAAAKAVGWTDQVDFKSALRAIGSDPTEDWRLRLEAFASLARLDSAQWISEVANFARSDDPGQQMEAAFVLSEIQSREASDALVELASDASLPRELRAAAAWGLGQGAAPWPAKLLQITLTDDDFVSLHAITAIKSLPNKLLPILIGWMSGPADRRAAIAAQLLQRHQCVQALLDACKRHDEARLWALRALGDLSPSLVISLGGDRLTPHIREFLEPMWRGQNDWLRTTGKDGLEALDIQKVRHDPFYPVL